MTRAQCGALTNTGMFLCSSNGKYIKLLPGFYTICSVGVAGMPCGYFIPKVLMKTGYFVTVFLNKVFPVASTARGGVLRVVFILC